MQGLKLINVSKSEPCVTFTRSPMLPWIFLGAPLKSLVASLMSFMASLVTTSRMQQCPDVLIDIYHEFLLLFYCRVLLEIKLAAAAAAAAAAATATATATAATTTTTTTTNTNTNTNTTTTTTTTTTTSAPGNIQGSVDRYVSTKHTHVHFHKVNDWYRN